MTPSSTFLTLNFAFDGVTVKVTAVPAGAVPAGVTIKVGSKVMVPCEVAGVAVTATTAVPLRFMVTGGGSGTTGDGGTVGAGWTVVGARRRVAVRVACATAAGV